MAAEVYFTGEKSVMGNKAMALGTVTLSGIASGACNLGIGYIGGGVVSIKSALSHNTQSVYFNEMSGATAADGWIHIRSGAAGDVFNIICWGRA